MDKFGCLEGFWARLQTLILNTVRLFQPMTSDSIVSFATTCRSLARLGHVAFAIKRCAFEILVRFSRAYLFILFDFI